MTDPIADMLTRIRNAVAVNKPSVEIPYSNLKNVLLQQLLSYGFILGVEVRGDGIEKSLVAKLSSGSGSSRISSLKRISKPGQRIYVGHQSIPKSKNGRGLVLVSTSSGIISDKEAREKRLGGELICEIY